MVQKQVGRNFSANGHQMATTGFMEYGAIDDSIVDKLRDDDNIRVRLQVLIIIKWLVAPLLTKDMECITDLDKRRN